MTKILAFFLGLNCLAKGWIITGLFLLYIAFAVEFEE